MPVKMIWNPITPIKVGFFVWEVEKRSKVVTSSSPVLVVGNLD